MRISYIDLSPANITRVDGLPVAMARVHNNRGHRLLLRDGKCPEIEIFGGAIVVPIAPLRDRQLMQSVLTHGPYYKDWNAVVLRVTTDADGPCSGCYFIRRAVEKNPPEEGVTRLQNQRTSVAAPMVLSSDYAEQFAAVWRQFALIEHLVEVGVDYSAELWLEKEVARYREPWMPPFGS